MNSSSRARPVGASARRATAGADGEQLGVLAGVRRDGPSPVIERASSICPSSIAMIASALWARPTSGIESQGLLVGRAGRFALTAHQVKVPGRPAPSGSRDRSRRRARASRGPLAAGAAAPARGRGSAAPRRRARRARRAARSPRRLRLPPRLGQVGRQQRQGCRRRRGRARAPAAGPRTAAFEVAAVTLELGQVQQSDAHAGAAPDELAAQRRSAPSSRRRRKATPLSSRVHRVRSRPWDRPRRCSCTGPETAGRSEIAECRQAPRTSALSGLGAPPGRSLAAAREASRRSAQSSASDRREVALLRDRSARS